METNFGLLTNLSYQAGVGVGSLKGMGQTRNYKRAELKDFGHLLVVEVQ